MKRPKPIHPYQSAVHRAIVHGEMLEFWNQRLKAAQSTLGICKTMQRELDAKRRAAEIDHDVAVAALEQLEEK